MQLKLKRTTRETGMLTKTTLFCLDAALSLEPAEAEAIAKYKLGPQVIYASERAKEAAAATTNTSGTVAGAAKAWANVIAARLALTITIQGLTTGQHIECKDVAELLEAENAIQTACENLKLYLAAAETFNGQERVIDYSGDKPTVHG